MSRRALALLALLLARPLAAQGAAYLRAHYRKAEVRIPMRDGVRLFTAIYTPREGPGPWPVLLRRTPYGIGPYGPDAFPDDLGPGEQEVREGYIFVDQDVRGKAMSEGSYREMTPLTGGAGVDEATDAWDTIDWLQRQLPGGSRRVGVWGISYDGFYAACALVDAHPALCAASPQAPIADLFDGDDDHHNGALFLSQAFWFAAAYGRARPAPAPRIAPVPGLPKAVPDGYRFFLDLGALANLDRRFFHGTVPSWTEEMAHGTRDGYWRARDLRPHLRAARPAVLTVGGWFDAEDLFGTLQVHQRLQAGAGGPRFLVMGPWSHGGWSWGDGDRLGPIRFGARTGPYFQEQIEAPFFRHFLKDGPDPGLAPATIFETGGNRWRSFSAWPPPGTRPTPLYLRAGGGLGFQPPTDAEGADGFVSDPAHPVPYTSGTEGQVSPAYMVEDQRFAARRPDVLVYRGPLLSAPLTVAGPVPVQLQVSTSGTDADWVVKLIDVWPGEPDETWAPADPELGGYQQLVRAEVLRGKFRNSLAAPEPFAPGRPTALAFTLNDICHTFRPGHRLMVQVQSSWFPLVDRNPQVFEDIYRARDRDFRPAEHRVHRSAALPSRLVLPVLDPD